ncbi:MAG TPA: hypothetical protein PLC08_00200 [Candidatus Bipolaricaulis sp.]|nr:hypothetical protein [Candidatus Bipolaricaulis sp.]HRS14237.1 hypothetical protein [Candidatus Bipolaricaulis sp.]HRU21690.1 hypothetical protein [Candidatus Bipolaricaulis sp.]
MGSLGDLPGWAIVVLGSLALIQLGLQVFALVTALRTPADRLLTGQRWVWIVVIALGLVGAIVFLAVARRPVPEPDSVNTTPDLDKDKARRAADLLYGTPPDSQQGRGRTSQ